VSIIGSKTAQIAEEDEEKMSDRAYRLSVGVLLLIGLYFELPVLIYSIIGIALFEAVTNLRIPIIVEKITGHKVVNESDGFNFKQRFNFDAERVWRLILAAVLIVVYVLFYDQLWYVAWFLGFAILGAGLSGVCPMFITIKWAGFR
jgi:hypothetical protein